MCPPNHEVLKTLAVEAGYGKKKVLKEVTFEICVREIVGLVGPNGSGKSTILKALYGLIPVDNGTIIYLGTQPITPTAPNNYAYVEKTDGWNKGIYKVEIFRIDNLEKVAFGSFEIEEK